MYRVIDPAAFDSRDCLTRSCQNEADHGYDHCGRCRRHAGNTSPGTPLEHGWPCKTDGCPGRTVARSGPLAYLCDDCVAAKRAARQAAA